MKAQFKTKKQKHTKAGEILVLDLEGTDALERGKNRGNFERQTSLFALTLSEVLIVNMWANDIGRSSGMNVDTLKAILEANLRLFSQKSKTLLLFLIREQNPDETQFGNSHCFVCVVCTHATCYILIVRFF